MGRNLVLLVSTIMAEVESILVSQKLYDLSLASPYSYHTKQSSCCFRLQMLNHNFQCGFQPTNHTTLIMQISVPGITLDSILLLTRNTHNKPTGFTLKANLVKNLNQGKTYYRQARLCCYPRIFSQTCDFLAELGLISLAIESEACEDNYLTRIWSKNTLTASYSD
ncbi:hypothetical protein VNO77_39235 [Canavalia gladiata]|uniref:Uncharacterized protein n=1 Tax=Canavalia gladiata TaxID=3824 RepID=A0AAN9PWX7_CANGL